LQRLNEQYAAPMQAAVAQRQVEVGRILREVPGADAFFESLREAEAKAPLVLPTSRAAQ
jgi:hypothetical protein